MPSRRVSYTLPRCCPRDSIVHFQAGRREYLEGDTASIELNVRRSIRKAFRVGGWVNARSAGLSWDQSGAALEHEQLQRVWRFPRCTGARLGACKSM